MPETVCVTLEQLREWMNAIMKTSIRHLSDPQEVQFFADQFRSLELAIAQAERLKDWKPKIAQPVRIVAMPSVGPLFIATLVHGAPDGEMAELFIKRESGTFLFGRRYLAELMPEEGE